MSRHEKMLTSSAKISDRRYEAVDMDVNGHSTSVLGDMRLDDQESELPNEFMHSNKRAKISTSGSWCPGMGNDQQVRIDRATNSSPMSLCSRSVDSPRGSPDNSNHQNAPPYASLLSGAKTRAEISTSTSTSSSSKSLRKPKTKTEPENDASSFTIYEDPEDRDLQSFTLDLGMGYGLEFGLTYRYEHDLSSPGIPIPVPEAWHSYPGDDKENTEEMTHENGTDGEHEADGGVDHGIRNGNNNDESSAVIVDDVNEHSRQDLIHEHLFNHQDTEDSRQYHQNRTRHETIVVPSGDRSQVDSQSSPTLLGAPPRRFQARGSSRQT